ncbi:hypothetical protein B5E53_00820 [Eubacterium sp. An11]|nr:hypothetical protein B5E53_00820 [Eubacterium sp. An11]
MGRLRRQRRNVPLMCCGQRILYCGIAICKRVIYRTDVLHITSFFIKSWNLVLAVAPGTCKNMTAT